MANQAEAYFGFYSVKRLGVFLLPPGWDASPSQLRVTRLGITFFGIPYTPGWREAL